ncbi:MAG TPA: ABC transporter ATP-binding protein [Anaeromyxobacteraceae bacterium]|nr:ABC transporter ATP-binding protein [Anaeromyxobacteraceae bacterium]
MIRVDKLTRRYGPLLAVDEVSFTIGQGEVVGLLGHNGAGKTTIMKMLTGYLEPTGGTIQVRDLVMGRDTRAIQARIGYLPENCPAWPEMTVVDYLEYRAGLQGLAPGRRRAAVAQAIRRTDLADKTTSSIHALSRGYRQRVGVAQALLHRPEILILDEPTNGLDPTQIRHMRELVRDLSRSSTVVVSTHVLQEVQAVCERVLIMRSGKLALDARLEDLQRGGGLLLQVEGDARAALGGLPGISGIEEGPSRNGVRTFRLRAPPDTAPDVAAAVARAGLRLHALQPERRDLEAVFADVVEEGARV